MIERLVKCDSCGVREKGLNPYKSDDWQVIVLPDEPTHRDVDETHLCEGCYGDLRHLLAGDPV